MRCSSNNSTQIVHSSMFSSRRGLRLFSKRTVTVLFLFFLGGVLGLQSVYAQKDFEEWKKEQRKQYQQFVNEQDKAFLKFLKKQWKHVDAEPQMGSPINDKPNDIPTAGGDPSPVANQGQESQTETSAEKESRQEEESQEEDASLRRAQEASREKTYESKGRAAPEVDLTTMTKDRFALSDLEGKVVLINFWATYCGPCRAEIPALNGLYANLKSDGLEIVGIAVDRKGREVVEPFSEEYNLKYPVVLNPSASLWSEFSGEHGRIPLPTTFVVNTEGQIVHRIQGEFPLDRMTPKIKDMLGIKTDESQQVSDRTEERTSSEQAEHGSVDSSNLKTSSVSFFGATTSVGYNPALTPTIDGPPDKDAIRSFWKSMASEEYQNTLSSLQKRRTELGLSDWGYYTYLKKVGRQIYEKETVSTRAGEPSLWTWFMMIKSGYGVRLGYREDDVFLMLPVNSKIYNLPQDFIDGQRYYLMMGDSGGGSYRTYEGQHDQASKILNLDEGILPKLKGDPESRTSSFSYDGERYNIAFKYDPALLEYVKSYPNFELSVLFQSGVSTVAESSLQESLRPHVKDRSPRDALNFLLRFVQFVSEYKVNGEKFPEQTLSGEPSDCEDRAVLFAYLVRSLLDRPLVGLDWPNHIATAVKVGDGLNATSKDETVTVDGETYIVADPTYIKGNLGMKMTSPPLKDTKPGIIKF